MRISVCVVTCNGAKFIRRQLESIISQKLLPDEIIVVDDFSYDGTLSIVKEILSNVKIKFHIFQNEKRLGVNKTFEKCLVKASYDIVVFSDQDDYWFEERLFNIKAVFLNHPSAEVVLVNAYIKKNGKIKESTLDRLPFTKSFLANFIKNRFIGCQMAVNRNFLKRLYPFPKDEICFYDKWIASFSLLRNSPILIYREQGYYCRHSNTLTDFSSNRSLIKKIESRSRLFFCIIKKYIFEELYND